MARGRDRHAQAAVAAVEARNRPERLWARDGARSGWVEWPLQGW